MNDEDWKDPETARLDLILENRGLEDEIRMLGGTSFGEDDMDPALKNGFLRHVLNFEKHAKQPMVPVRSFFPADFRLPRADEMTEAGIQAKIREIKEILARNNVGFGFANKLPPAVLYTYLAEEVIPYETVFPPEAQVGFMLDGCDGGCGECFQRDYCRTGQDTLRNEHP